MRNNGAMNQLDALKQFTTVVADTGDFCNWPSSVRKTPRPTLR